MKRLLITLVVVVAATGAAPIAAADEGGVFGDFVDDEEDVDWSAVAAGVLDKVMWQASQYTSLSDAEADQEAAEADRAALQETFNANNESIENYTNARFTGNASEWDVIAIHHVRDDGEATQYLVADANESNFSNARMVNSTDRTVDQELTLEGYASDNADAELETFLEKFVEEDRDVTQSYVSQLASKYSGYVELPEDATNETN